MFMIPVSNGKTSPCSPISSNCVIWQGPDIPCINICNGDTVSDVVGKLGEELCSIIDASCQCNPDISGLTLDCLPAETPLELQPVLQAIIDYICNLNPGEPGSLPNVELPQCLQYDDALGNRVLQLPLDQFAVLLGNKVCDILSDINSLQITVSNLQSRVTILENCVLPCVPTRVDGGDFDILSDCLFPGLLVPISQLVQGLESQFCEFRNAVGSVSLINQAISAQCLFGTTPRLSGPGTYSGVAGWVNSSTTLAQSNVNQWIAICDLYSAVSDIQNNCCDKGCDGVIFGVSYTTIDSNGDGVVEALNLNFTSSTIPAGFNDCSGNTVITITDSNGSSITQSVNVTALSTDPLGVNVSVASLNTLASLVLSVPFCVTDGTSQCSDAQTTIISLNIPCPTTITATSVLTDILVSFQNVLGTGVTYTIVAIDTTTGAALGSTTVTSPSTTVSHTFGGAIPGRTYNIIVTVSQGSSIRTCPPVSVVVAGSTCANFFTTSTTSVNGASDIYLGHEAPGGDLKTPYWYDPIAQQIVVGTPVTVTCDAPLATNLSISVSGVITVDLNYSVGGTAITTNYSIDGITWSPDVTAGPGTRNIATGATSGSVYFRAKTQCIGSSTEYLIYRYDFATDYWTILANPSIAQCDNGTIPGTCPTGVEVATQVLSCDGSNYTVFGGGVNSKWYYVGKYVRFGNTVYIYAGWKDTFTPGTAASSILECCICPAFISTDTIQVFCQEGAAVTFTVPYVLGEGSPNMTISATPVNGTLTQSTSVSNEFTYTNTVAGQYGDTFGVNLLPSVSGVCEQATATIQIQIIPCSVALLWQNQPIYAFIDTGSYSVSEGSDIKSGLTQLAVTWNSLFGYVGDIYFIPVADNKYLGYQKSIVDDGASATLDTDPAWVALQNLPPLWTASGAQYKNGAFLIAFVNSAATDYHATTLASGFIGQPTSAYAEDYDAFIDALTGTQTSAWAQALGLSINQYPDGFSAILYPFTVKSSTSADAAMILQSLGAYTAEMIPPAEYGIKTVTDVTGYLMQGLVPSASNPYNAFITSGGNTVLGLYRAGWLALLNNIEKSSTYSNINLGQDDQFNSQLTLAIESCSETYPSSSLSLEGYRMLSCQTGTIVKVEWLAATDPLPTEFWSFQDPVVGEICGKIISGREIFSTVDHTTGVSVTSLIVGCESCSPLFLVEDCETGSQYTVNASAWISTGIQPGMIFSVTNTGPAFIPGDGRADWFDSAVKCVEIISIGAAAEITSSTETGPFANCLTCLAP